MNYKPKKEQECVSDAYESVLLQEEEFWNRAKSNEDDSSLESFQISAIVRLFHKIKDVMIMVTKRILWLIGIFLITFTSGVIPMGMHPFLDLLIEIALLISLFFILFWMMVGVVLFFVGLIKYFVIWLKWKA